MCKNEFHEPFQSRVRHFFCRALQSHNSPGDWARELFKPSTDSASLLVKIEKKIFVLGLSFSGRNVTSRGVFALFWPSLPGPGRRPNGPFFGLKSLVENWVKIRVYRAFDWHSSISGAKIMAHEPKIDQNFAPSKVTLGDISPQAVTRRQIELESCSNPLKTREGM